MTDTSPSLLGQLNLAGDDTALYLKMFSGEVMATFARSNIMSGLHRTKIVGPGRSHQFPALGEAEANYHVRGEDLLDPANGYLNLIEHGERTIQPDKPLIAPTFVDNWDEKIRHYEYRADYARVLGQALGRKMDQQELRLVALAARSTATLSATQSPDKDGSVIIEAGAATDAAVMESAIVQAATALAQKDVPMEGLVFILRPSMYFLLQQNGRLLDVNYGNAGNGSQAGGSLLRGYGFRILTSNNLPSTNVAAVTGELNAYNGDFRDTAAVAFHYDAIGTVIREGIQTEQEYVVKNQGWLLLAKAIVGHGILRPEAAVEIQDPDLTP